MERYKYSPTLLSFNAPAAAYKAVPHSLSLSLSPVSVLLRLSFQGVIQHCVTPRRGKSISDSEHRGA